MAATRTPRDLHPLDRAWHSAFVTARLHGYDVDMDGDQPHVYCPSCETRVLHSTLSHRRLHEELGPAVTGSGGPWWRP